MSDTNECRKKENDTGKKWYAGMDALEALWRTKIAESRVEYLETFLQVTKKRSKPDFPRN
ncbi:MAG: hypothetical protein U5P10_13060 [Spirochaetia bacterium]|nr:hypothetical protein [Spirochaetia bacterium]